MQDSCVAGQCSFAAQTVNTAAACQHVYLQDLVLDLLELALVVC